MHTITARTKDNAKREVTFDYYPDICPVCHTAAEIKRDYAEGYLFPFEAGNYLRYLQIIFRCPRLSCGTHFVVHYEAPKSYESYGDPYQSFFFRKRIFPNIPKQLDIPNEVRGISPRFVEIVNQANAADSQSLDDVSGMAYRKALEFLIKDYCIKRHPDKEADIRSLHLMKCINTYVSDGNVKECAKRATWLGNDETHYERIWNDHDIEDLKILIRLTQNWIDNELLTAQYISEISAKK
jgi:hypothetical protein